MTFWQTINRLIDFKMRWKSFQSHLQTSHIELYHTKQFADVTLVSDDMVKYPAHKTILAASSKVFKSLLSIATSEQQHYPFLYLKDINHKDLEDILQYVYLGKAEVSESRAKYFENTMKDLGIHESSVDSILEPHVKKSNQEEENVVVEKLDFLLFPTDNETQQNTFSSKEGDDMEREWNVSSYYIPEALDSYQDDCNSDNIPEAGDLLQEDNNSEIVNEDRNPKMEDLVSQKIKNSKKKSNQYRKKEEEATECEMCLAKFTTKRSYQRHYKVIHELKFEECDECGKQFKAWGKIDAHKQSVHRKIRFPCTQCEYTAVSMATIKKHVQKEHWFHCENCKVSYEHKTDFQNHIQTEHIGKYC